mgnify:FL=1
MGYLPRYILWYETNVFGTWRALEAKQMEAQMDSTKSLLEVALSTELKRRSGKHISDQERELALAWVHGKVSITQVAAAMGVKTGGVYPFLANALKDELLKGY